MDELVFESDQILERSRLIAKQLEERIDEPEDRQSIAATAHEMQILLEKFNRQLNKVLYAKPGSKIKTFFKSVKGILATLESELKKPITDDALRRRRLKHAQEKYEKMEEVHKKRRLRRRRIVFPTKRGFGAHKKPVVLGR
uniref:Valine--tRNA ligase n=1 Tax=Lygus hesperus TaxID=30085 RepID=A0A0A9WQE9_LYGHE